MSTGRQHRHRPLPRTALAFLAFLVIVNLSTPCRAAGKDELGSPTNPAAAREAGMTEARRDLSNGVRIVKTAGLVPPDRPDYEHLLKDHCNPGIEPTQLQVNQRLVIPAKAQP